ncbi:MAG TPA: hypothetical protein DCS93_09690 [Microscillaceae bacterium]|nr:hypothetical protein [Microscillaceae bacterium]
MKEKITNPQPTTQGQGSTHRLQVHQAKTKQVPSVKAKQQPIQAKQRPIQSKHKPLQRKSSTSIIQRQKEQNTGDISNNTGLPTRLKDGIENLSGYTMDDVKVHYNSSKPAQLNAHAYAQSTDIHVGPGQEQHLPHEAWHVVQQKQGRVKPTMQLKGKVAVNDDVDLEKEADIMGAKAQNTKSEATPTRSTMQSEPSADGIVQRVIHHNVAQDGTEYWTTDLEVDTITRYDTKEEAQEAEKLIIESGRMSGSPKRERTAYGLVHFFDKRTHPNGPHTLANVGIDQSIKDIDDQDKLDRYSLEVNQNISNWGSTLRNSMDEAYHTEYEPGIDHYEKEVDGLRASNELLETTKVPKKLKRRLSGRNLRASFNLHPFGSYAYGRGATQEELDGKSERKDAPESVLFDSGGVDFFGDSEEYSRHEELGKRLLSERKFVKPEGSYESNNSPERKAYRAKRRAEKQREKRRLEKQKKKREKQKKEDRKKQKQSRAERAKSRDNYKRKEREAEGESFKRPKPRKKRKKEGEDE